MHSGRANDAMVEASLRAAQSVMQADDSAALTSRLVQDRIIAQQKYRASADLQNENSPSDDCCGAPDGSAPPVRWGGWSVGVPSGDHQSSEESSSSLVSSHEWVGKNICRHWAKGYCNRGGGCHFSHAGPSPNRVLCPDAGAPLVVNSHGNSLPTTDELKRGDKFIVVKSTQPCKDYAAGECYRGDHCRFAHVGSGAARSSGCGVDPHRRSSRESSDDVTSEGHFPPSYVSPAPRSIAPSEAASVSPYPTTSLPHSAHHSGNNNNTIVIITQPQSGTAQQGGGGGGGGYPPVRTVRYVYGGDQQQQGGMHREDVHWDGGMDCAHHHLPPMREAAFSECGYSLEGAYHHTSYIHDPASPVPEPIPTEVMEYRGNRHAIPGYGVGHGA